MTERFKTFEALGIKNEPYVLEFKKLHGEFPVMEVRLPIRMPTRYETPDGKMKYHMKTTYRPGEKFRVVGIEPAKRAPDAVNVVLAHPSDPGSQVVLTPADLIKKMHIDMTGGESKLDGDPFDDAPWEDETPTPKPAVSGKVKEILEKRRKEALVSI